MLSCLAPKEDTSSSGGLQLGAYENVKEKLRKERSEEYRKFLAEVQYALLESFSLWLYTVDPRFHVYDISFERLSFENEALLPK